MKQEKKQKHDMDMDDLPFIPNAYTVLNKEEFLKMETYMNQSREFMSKFFVSNSQ